MFVLGSYNILLYWSECNLPAAKSSLYYLEPQLGWQPTTFHRPQIYLLSYYIDFRQLRFGLQMKVNAGGCTHRDKLDVVSKYKIFTVPAY